ncbi:MAG: ABC transporter permease [Armatimonadota bacterium]|nr:ABC transporter permease [Armatimonadota bacterium]
MAETGARTRLPAWQWARRLLRNRVTPVGLIIVAAAVVTAVAAPVLVPYDPMAMRTQAILQGPSRAHVLGTDQFGRDILSRIIIGARVSLLVAVLSVAVALALGTTVGLLSGYLGRWVDGLAMRLMDILFAFPAILLAIAIMAVAGTSMRNLILAIGVVYTPQFARVARAATLTVKNLEFVEAAQALGAGAGRVLARHLLPNVMPAIIVQVSLSLSLAILSESALSFLGLGTQPPTPSWGNMLSEGRQFMEIAPWNAVFPGAAIMLVVLGFNLLGDGLRDLLDPRLR